VAVPVILNIRKRGREGFNSTDSDLPREIRLWVLTDLSCV